MQGVMGESYERSAMDFEFLPASPDSRWIGETAARRRRRLSSPSLRAFLTPAFDAVAEREGAAPASGYSTSSSSGGLDLAFDASLLRYRRAYLDGNGDLGNRVLHFSPQSAPPPPPPPQTRVVYPLADDGIWAHGVHHYGTKPLAGGRFAATPVFHDFDGISFMSPRQTSATHPSAQGASNSIKLPADLQEGTVRGTKIDHSTPKAEGKASPEQASPNEEVDDLYVRVLYGHSGKRRLPVFVDICPE